MNGYKVVLSSGKIVLLRKMKLSDHENAAESAGMKFSTEAGQRASMAKELLKSLLVKVNDKAITGLQREALDDMFEIDEYLELIEVVNKTTGIGEKKAKPKVEAVNIGEKSPGSPDTPA